MLQSISLGKATVGVRDGFWVPEFSIERLKTDPGGVMEVEMEAARFDLAGAFASRLSSLFEIVGLVLRPGQAAEQTVRGFFETLDKEAVMVDFGTQLISTVEPEGILTEINFAFGVPELMGHKFELASRSPTNLIGFLGSS